MSPRRSRRSRRRTASAPEDSAPRRSLVRPTGRGAIALVLAPLLLIASEITGLAQLRLLACALALSLALGLVAILLGGVRLDLRRRVASDSVPAGRSVDVEMSLVPGSLLGGLSLGRGVVRAYLPDALGGHGDLPLAASMNHRVVVRRRGVHDLGPCAILVRDVLGLFHRRRIVPASAQVTGLPVAEEIDPVLAGRLAAAIGGSDAAAHRAQGEPGPIARPYAAGDDMRRIHWKASARSGRLMTREDEPTTGAHALIVLDTRGPEQPLDDDALAELVAAQDRVVDHAATSLLALRAQGFDVTVLDASGDRIIAAAREHRTLGSVPGRGGAISARGAQADAIAEHTALLALAGVGFGDREEDLVRRPDQGSAGPVAVVLAIGAGDAEDFAGLDLDRFAGSAPRRLALAILPAAAADPAISVRAGRGHGSWSIVEADRSAGLGEILHALAGAPTGDPVRAGGGR